MDRKMYDRLVAWKKKEKRNCLVVTGQRQVGKTYIITKFAEENYDNFVYLNLTDEEQRKFFQGSIKVDSIISKLELHYENVRILPRKTLIFIDEIQNCPPARASLKEFSLDGRYDVIASGSLLGVQVVGNPDPWTKDIPVGYEDDIVMYSMDFEEFLWARGVKKDVIAGVRDCIRNRKPIDDSVLDRLNALFTDFLVIGGMPAVVQRFLDTRSYADCAETEEFIIATIRADINRYSDRRDRARISECFDSIPAQLAKSNKKFIYSKVGGSGRKDQDSFLDSLVWIKGAGYGNFCYRLSAPILSLAGYEEPDNFKVYMSDTGILTTMYGPSCRKAILSGDTAFNMGAIAENAVAECLTKCGFQPRFYKENKGERRMEIDFVIETVDEVVAIEVKSGKSRESPSLSKVGMFFKVRRVMLENGNVHVDEGGVEHYPLFAAAFIGSLEAESASEYVHRHP